MATQELMQVRAAARELGVHENTLRRWAEAGFIDAVRLPSGVRRFRVDDVNELRAQMHSRSGSGNPVVEEVARKELGAAVEPAAVEPAAVEPAAVERSPATFA
jgi:excisionase family DNA binding protein